MTPTEAAAWLRHGRDDEGGLLDTADKYPHSVGLPTRDVEAIRTLVELVEQTGETFHVWGDPEPKRVVLPGAPQRAQDEPEDVGDAVVLPEDESASWCQPCREGRYSACLGPLCGRPGVTESGESVSDPRAETSDPPTLGDITPTVVDVTTEGDVL